MTYLLEIATKLRAVRGLDWNHAHYTGGGLTLTVHDPDTSEVAVVSIRPATVSEAIQFFAPREPIPTPQTWDVEHDR